MKKKANDKQQLFLPVDLFPLCYTSKGYLVGRTIVLRRSLSERNG